MADVGNIVFGPVRDDVIEEDYHPYKPRNWPQQMADVGNIVFGPVRDDVIEEDYHPYKPRNWPQPKTKEELLKNMTQKEIQSTTIPEEVWNLFPESIGITKEQQQKVDEIHDIIDKIKAEQNQDALSKQVGGTHYKQYKIQPYEFFLVNQIPHHKAAIIRRILRYDHPTGKGLEDLEKIRHEIDLIIQLENWRERSIDASATEEKS